MHGHAKPLNDTKTILAAPCNPIALVLYNNKTDVRLYLYLAD
jgi:hypothetical protein